MTLLKSLFIVLFISGLCACTHTEKANVPDPKEKGTYFSIKQFAKDQWDNSEGQPYTLNRIVTMNGKRDSSLVSAFNIDWGTIFKMFFETDIGEKKYLGQYTFNMFEDDLTQTRNFYYEAKDKKLFTRTLQISADEFTNKIRSIYIETEKESPWEHHVQKLYYAPLKVIQIQEFESAALSPSKELRIEYRFL